MARLPRTFTRTHARQLTLLVNWWLKYKENLDTLIANLLTATGESSLTFIGSTTIIDIPANQTMTFYGKITGRSDTGDHAEYDISGLIYADATPATTTLLRSAVTPLYEDNAAWTVLITANTTTGSLQLTGYSAGDNVSWSGFILTARADAPA